MRVTFLVLVLLFINIVTAQSLFELKQSTSAPNIRYGQSSDPFGSAQGPEMVAQGPEMSAQGTEIVTQRPEMVVQRPEMVAQGTAGVMPLNEAGVKKNTGIALLLSALLPGMGEYYAGTFSTSGKYFTMAEAGLLVGYVGMTSYARWQKENYKSFAVTKGGAKGTNFDDDYYANISNYSDITQYNNDKAANQQYSQLYDVNDKFWSWGTETARKEYRTMWVATQHSNNNLRFVVGGMLLNRLFSIINAVRSVASYNKSLDQGSGSGVSLKYDITFYQENFNSLTANCRVSF